MTFCRCTPKSFPWEPQTFCVHSKSLGCDVQVLMETKYKDGKSLTMKEITGIMVATLLGGQHTSNVTGTWAMCHLFKDKEWWDNVMSEQRSLLGGDLGQDLVMEDVEAMVEFDKVLNETLRLHPPFFQLARVTTKPTEYKGYVIPPGRMVSVSPGAAQRLPSLWGDNADEFDPMRWEPNAVKEHKRSAWIPFGGGRHQCSGEIHISVATDCFLIHWMLLCRPQVCHHIPQDSAVLAHAKL